MATRALCRGGRRVTVQPRAGPDWFSTTGADMHRKAAGGQTALSLAREHRHEAVVEVLRRAVARE